MVARRMTVQPSVLTWARESANLNVTEAAHRINVSVSRIEQWESGELDPTINQLRKAADVYTRPLGALFLETPIVNETRFDLPDFRRPEVEQQESPALRKAILRARRQRDAIRDVVEDGADLPVGSPNNFSLKRTDTTGDSGKALRAVLGLSTLSARILSKPDDLFRSLVQRVEQLGFLVIQVQHVSTSEMRGFSLAGDLMPIIAINGADWPRGKVFTLLHELVHVAMRHSGLCDFSRDSSQPEERYCDEVAAEALMPGSLFRAAAAGVNPARYGDLRAIGDQFGVSAEAVLIRLVHLRMATWDDYAGMKSSFDGAYNKYKKDEKLARGDKDSPIYYQLKVRDLGRPFIATVLRAHGNGLLSSRDVTQLLDVKYDNVPKLAARLGGEALV